MLLLDRLSLLAASAGTLIGMFGLILYCVVFEPSTLKFTHSSLKKISIVLYLFSLLLFLNF